MSICPHVETGRDAHCVEVLESSAASEKWISGLQMVPESIRVKKKKLKKKKIKGFYAWMIMRRQETYRLCCWVML